MSTDVTLSDIKNSHQLCEVLMRMPRYQKMGIDEVFLIVATAKSLGVDPIMALSGGLYCVQGRIEMSSRLMNALIHSRKHVVSVCEHESNERICVINGKRSDTESTAKASFSMEDAHRAGLLSNPTWKKYPEDMLFARALSRLARRLFPDIIGNCYVEGELRDSYKDPHYLEEADAKILDAAVEAIKDKEITFNPTTSISEEEHTALMELLDQLPDYKNELLDFLRKRKINDFREISMSTYKTIINNAQMKLEQKTIPI